MNPNVVMFCFCVDAASDLLQSADTAGATQSEAAGREEKRGPEKSSTRAARRESSHVMMLLSTTGPATGDKANGMTRATAGLPRRLVLGVMEWSQQRASHAGPRPCAHQREGRAAGKAAGTHTIGHTRGVGRPEQIAGRESPPRVQCAQHGVCVPRLRPWPELSGRSAETAARLLRSADYALHCCESSSNPRVCLGAVHAKSREIVRRPCDGRPSPGVRQQRQQRRRRGPTTAREAPTCCS